MTAHKGYYSLIQYCPDASRAEAANVGVLLFCPDLRFIEARTSDDHARIRRFFGPESFDPARITAAKRAVEDYIRLHTDQFRSLDDLRRFIDTRANEMIVTEPRPLKVVDPAAELDELFAQLVGGQASVRRRAAIAELDRAMRSPQLQGRVRFDNEIIVPVVGTKMKIPYAYHNGQPNLIRPTAFGLDEGQAVRQAAFLAYAGDMLRKKPDSKGQTSRLIVASAAPDGGNGAGQNIEEHVQQVFAEYELEFYRRNRIAELIARVTQDAHPLDSAAAGGTLAL